MFNAPVKTYRLTDYKTGSDVGPATRAQLAASRAAAKRDGGAGVIVVRGQRVYVGE